MKLKINPKKIIKKVWKYFMIVFILIMVMNGYLRILELNTKCEIKTNNAFLTDYNTTFYGMMDDYCTTSGFLNNKITCSNYNASLLCYHKVFFGLKMYYL